MSRKEKERAAERPEDLTGETPVTGSGQPGDIREETVPGEECECGPSAEELAAAVALLEERNKELTEALAAARADFFNYRKRIERDRQRERVMAGEEKALEFLPVLDNLDRALAVESPADGKSILQGVTMVRRQFLYVLESMGVEQIPTVGTPFSPECHEAVAAEETDDPARNGMVTGEILSGYRTKERILRPAKVKVASCAQPGNE
jgi:molecular chaperone GrpE (heat shock protein)